jgi:hypothetical protein
MQGCLVPLPRCFVRRTKQSGSKGIAQNKASYREDLLSAVGWHLGGNRS